MYLDSCKDLVETREDIRWAVGRKWKLEEELKEVNGQLFVMYKHLNSDELRNMCLKVSYVRKLRFSGQNVSSVGGGKYVVKEECKTDSQFDEIDDKQLVSMCEKAEKGEEKKVYSKK